jgi:hypothetical protein
MPLYGIEGLRPTLTMLSADNAAVRTLYSLESGEALEIVQRTLARQPQAADGSARSQDAAVTVVAEAPVVDVQSARQQAAPAPPVADVQSGRVADAASWSIIRGDWQLTLRGPADLIAFGDRLRLD